MRRDAGASPSVDTRRAGRDAAFGDRDDEHDRQLPGGDGLEIAALLRRPDGITRVLYGVNLDGPPQGVRALDVDKAWHGIHFLLTGEGWTGRLPLGFIVSGGRGIGDVDVGYGPARGFTSGEVREIADALAPISREALLARWDAERIREADLYGVNPDDPDGESEYLGQHFEALKRFISELASEGRGMIVYLS